MQRFLKSATVGYVAAVVSIIISTVIRLLLDPLIGKRFPAGTHFMAVLVIAAYAGRGPALLATLLGLVSFMVDRLRPELEVAVWAASS
jgi:K+-sensing histidine kinase KdpD